MSDDKTEAEFFGRKLRGLCMAHDPVTLRACVVDPDEHAGRDHEFPPMTYGELKGLTFTPVARTSEDEADGVYRYADQHGRVFILNTHRNGYGSEQP